MDPNISMVENNESLKPDPIIGDCTGWKELDKNFFKMKDGGFSFVPPERYYYIAPHGVIVSMLYQKPHLMKGSLQNGYPRFKFVNKNGSYKNCLLHRLVCYHFRGGFAEDEMKDQVDHIDGKKNNNHVYNLEWLTRSENVKRSYEKEKHFVNGTYHLNMHQIRRIMFMSAILISLNM